MIVLKAVENIEGFRTTVTFENISTDNLEHLDEILEREISHFMF